MYFFFIAMIILCFVVCSFQLSSLIPIPNILNIPAYALAYACTVIRTSMRMLTSVYCLAYVCTLLLLYMIVIIVEILIYFLSCHS